MELFLDLSRFELLSFPPTGSLDAEPGLDTWTANIVARAVIATLEVSGVQLKLGRERLPNVILNPRSRGGGRFPGR